MACSRYFAILVTLLSLSSGNLCAQNYDDLIAEAMQLRNSGSFAEAETLLRQAHASAADQQESYYLLAMTVAFQQRFDEALELLDEALAIYPENLTLRISYARVLSYQGEFNAADRSIDWVLEQDPENTEALNLGGRVSIYSNQPSRAIELYSQTLAIDADNLEAQIGMHDAYRALGDEDQANTWLSSAATLAPDNLDVRTRQDWQIAPEPSWQVTYGYGNSHFRRIPLDEWYDSFIEAHRQDGRGNDLYARVESNGHFGMSDTLFAVGTVRNMNSAMPWGAKVEYSPDAVFVPDYRINLFVSPRLREGGDLLGPTISTLSAQYASYPEAQVGQLGLRVDQYLFNGRAWLSPSLTTVLDENSETSTGWNIQANILLNENVLMGFGYGEAPQTENATTASTRTTHIFAKATLTDYLDVRIDWVREDRENSYLRYGSTFALIWKY